MKGGKPRSVLNLGLDCPHEEEVLQCSLSTPEVLARAGKGGDGCEDGANMDECPQCRTLERHLRSAAIEYLCATQQRGIDRDLVKTVKKDLDEAEERFNLHRASHESQLAPSS